MLSSLYGNLPPPEAKKPLEASGGTSGFRLGSRFDSKGDVGTKKGEESGFAQDGQTWSAAATGALAASDANVMKGGEDAVGGLSAWSTSRAKLFVPPTLRTRQQQSAATSTAKKDSARGIPPPSSTQPSESDESTGSRSTSTTTVAVSSLNESTNWKSLSPERVTKRSRSGAAYVENDCIDERRQEIDPKKVYDPAKPNNYDQVIRERALKRRHVEIERQQREELERLKASRQTTGPSHLSLNVSGEEAWRRRSMLSAGAATQQPTDSSAGGRDTAGLTVGAQDAFLATGADNKFHAASVGVDGSAGGGPASGGGRKQLAMRMMEQMGWKSGEGLGREKQGIVAPLVARKTDRKSGVIIQGKHVPNLINRGAEGADGPFKGNSTAAAQRSLNILEVPSRVVLLLNLVGRGEVDQELEEETAEEASKYGNLLGVQIREQGPTVRDSEAVRVFLEYESKEHALTAYTTFSGRFFGGRVVKAAFYDEASYLGGDLSRPVDTPARV